MSAALLKLTDVHTHIGAYHILHGVELSVVQGQLTMLLGRNGAGKTTTLRTIMGLWQASAGQIEFGGTSIVHTPTPLLARMGIAYVPENMGIFGDLTVAENMTLAARAARDVDALDRARLDWLFGLFPALRKFWLYPAGLLSGGQKQMLAVARALIEPRRLILVDEPSKGLAPAIVTNMIRAFQELKHGATTVLLVEQNMQFAQELGDSVAVMDDGRIVHQGSMANFATDTTLQERLLGLSLGPARTSLT
jgi:branched-chain amino acid transport system ATP-binding protein